MSAEIRTVRFPERVMKQIRLDSHRAMVRGRFCPDRSEVLNLQCLDNRRETDHDFGTQLWYFEAVGVDEFERRLPLFGIVHYSIQYGLNEVVEDGVFESAVERERFHRIYRGESLGPTWNIPANRWLMVAFMLTTAATVFSLMKLLGS